VVSSRRRKLAGTPGDPVQSLTRAGREQSAATLMFLSAVAEHLGLSLTELNAIGLIDRLGPLSAGELSVHTGLATASVTSLIDRLEAKGFACRSRDDGDRRRVIVELRPERAAAVGPMFDSLHQSVAQLLGDYSDDELGVILDFMIRATDLMRTEAIKVRRPAETPTPRHAGSGPGLSPRAVARLQSTPRRRVTRQGRMPASS
jgi:DNA-binding MarR family transcriptional regulator